jgi:hypothetical protein
VFLFLFLDRHLGITHSTGEHSLEKEKKPVWIEERGIIIASAKF